MITDPNSVRLDGPALVLEGSVGTGPAPFIRLSPLFPLQVWRRETGRPALTFEAQSALPEFAAQIADECGRREWGCPRPSARVTARY